MTPERFRFFLLRMCMRHNHRKIVQTIRALTRAELSRLATASGGDGCPAMPPPTAAGKDATAQVALVRKYLSGKMCAL